MDGRAGRRHGWRLEVVTASKKTDWWYSADGRRGFCFGAVKGYDYKPLAQSGGGMGNVIYLYLDGGLLHLTGAEADSVFGLVKGRDRS